MLNEIGWVRLAKYAVFGLWDWVFQLLPWSPLRVFWLKIAGADAAWSAVVERIHFLNLDRTGLLGLSLGEKSFVGVATVIDLAGRVQLGPHATISPSVVILSHFSVGFSDHPLVSQYPKKVGATKIGAGTFIGANATVLSGVTVGDRALVAAGSVVTRDVDSDTMVAGVPAKLKKKIHA